jgi:hypothetical protein
MASLNGGKIHCLAPPPPLPDGFMRFALLACLLAILPLSAKGQESVTFEKDIEPILACAGSNSGPCHGKSRGQNGFQLSLLGYDPQFDFQAIVSEARGRRIFAAAPEQSLFLTKPAGLVPHGGGKKLRVGERDYNVLLNWIRGGMPRTPASEPKLERIQVEPTERTLRARETFQLVVTAHYRDGQTRDVTPWTMFQSNESVLAAVDGEGKVAAARGTTSRNRLYELKDSTNPLTVRSASMFAPQGNPKARSAEANGRSPICGSRLRISGNSLPPRTGPPASRTFSSARFLISYEGVL